MANPLTNIKILFNTRTVKADMWYPFSITNRVLTLNCLRYEDEPPEDTTRHLSSIHRHLAN